MTRCQAFHSHARSVLDHELHRARGRLTALPHDQRREVEEVSARVAAALVDGVLDCARGDPVLAAALASIYGAEPAWEPRAVLWVAD